MDRRYFSIAAAAFAASCAQKREARFDYGEPKTKYTLIGKILRLRPDMRTALIQHQKIDGWMEAMTMEFPVPSAAEYAKLKEGAKVRATVCVNDSFYWLTDVTTME